MTDVTLKELKTVVERAVRPVRASICRKGRMREELLTHLVSIFEKEAERAGDEQAALVEAKERFGDPKELTSELQESVPREDQLRRFLGSLLSHQEGEPLLRRVARLRLLIVVSYAAMLLIVSPIVLILGTMADFGVAAYLLFVIAVATSLAALIFGRLVQGMSLALFREAPSRSLCRALVYALISVVVTPLFGFVLSWAIGGNMGTSYAECRSSAYVALLSPILLVIGARLIAKRTCFHEEWASLEIGE
jgi:hypothetical protein